jgi:hypothetical protein
MPFQPYSMTEELDAFGQIGNPGLLSRKFETCALVQVVGKSGLFVLGLLASARHQDHKIIGITDREEHGDPAPPVGHTRITRSLYPIRGTVRARLMAVMNPSLVALLNRAERDVREQW